MAGNKGIKNAACGRVAKNSTAIMRWLGWNCQRAYMHICIRKNTFTCRKMILSFS
jgi:hypothetical protein